RPWLRSAWQATTIPLGLCKIRTAVSTLLTFCPPLPPLRNVPISRSAGLTSIGAVSAISGTTSTLANDVCRRLFASNGEMRTSRRVPHRPVHAALVLQMSVSVLACYEQSHRFNAHFLALLNVHRLRFEIAALDPALVHPK